MNSLKDFTLSDILENEIVVNLLNAGTELAEKLGFSFIDYDKLNLLNFDTKTIITLTTQDATKTYTGKIINFGYEVKDGKVDVQIHSDEKFLPGTPLEISFEIVHQTESLYILKQMLLMDGDIYYVEVENEDGQRTRREVEIGDFFDEYSNNEKIEYVEIKHGLQLGERLIVDIIE